MLVPWHGEEFINDHDAHTLSDVKKWTLKTPWWPRKCHVTKRTMWFEPCYHGLSHYYGGQLDSYWVDKKTLQTLVLKGVVKV